MSRIAAILENAARQYVWTVDKFLRDLGITETSRVHLAMPANPPLDGQSRLEVRADVDDRLLATVEHEVKHFPTGGFGYVTKCTPYGTCDLKGEMNC